MIGGRDAAWLGRALAARLDRLADELDGLAARLAGAARAGAAALGPA